jgi:hypothetical protein
LPQPIAACADRRGAEKNDLADATPRAIASDTSHLGHSRRYCHVRSVVRYPQHRTLPRLIETRLLVALLRPIRKAQTLQRPLPCPRFGRLGDTTHVRSPTIQHVDCNEPARNLPPGCCLASCPIAVWRRPA